MCPHGLRLDDPVGLFVVSLTPLAFSRVSLTLHKTCKLYLMFGCGSLHLLPSDLDEASQETVMLGSRLQAQLALSQVGAVISWLFPSLCSIFISANLVGRTNSGFWGV